MHNAHQAVNHTYSEEGSSEHDGESGISAPNASAPKVRQTIFLYLGSGSFLLGVILGSMSPFIHFTLFFAVSNL